ncbi:MULTISPECIES: MOSC domain-containing protein [unclassified Chelatococcus]|uniref:MOSC domain-containing protein n=1 Tax=unclassified Chelatococcus TaxID=2638111 RepID=UPI001BCE57D7|nr:MULTISPECIES: MOSC domain-containing protein [unclassified Chelatococcus]MBS7697893.1 MOSC domain-containing protein [Chelatococcus sp. YT9]MBX3558530.1 MOSC domain-containing protein [Chelatococcus sp.]
MTVTGDLFGPRIFPGRRLRGNVTATLKAGQGGGTYDFVTVAVSDLTVTYEGIPGDRHYGLTRLSGAREPWYPRGTEMRNDRQISLLAAEELADIASGLKIPSVKAEWIGGNIVVEGLPAFSMIPPRTRLMFAGGVVIAIDGQNAPCKYAGQMIAEAYPGRPAIALDFVKVAKRLRGLVGCVERPGIVRAGEEIVARVPEHWSYQPG